MVLLNFIYDSNTQNSKWFWQYTTAYFIQFVFAAHFVLHTISLFVLCFFFAISFLFRIYAFDIAMHTVPYVGYWGNPQEKAFSYLHSAHKCVFFAYVYFDTHSSGPVQVLHSTQTCIHSVYRFNVVRMQQLSLVLMHSHSVTCFPFDTVFAGTLVHFERRTLCAKSPIDFHT